MEELISLLSEYPFVASYRVLKFERTQTTRRLKVSIDVVDGSQLVISESTTPRGFRYAYHWQDNHNQLLARWDNSPHHPDLHTFPDHFHNRSKVESSVQPTIRDVFEYISSYLNK